MEHDARAVVIDAGSGWTKAGFAGDNAPHTIFPTAVGRPKQGGPVMLGTEQKDFYVGAEAMSKRGILSLKWPVEHGIVTNWDDMEKVWQHTFYDHLHAIPEEHPVLLADTTMNPKANREKTTQIMFETFNTPALYLAAQSVLALQSLGRRTGLVLESGESSTYAVPVVEGAVVSHAARHLSVGGRDISHVLEKLLCERGFVVETSSQREIIRDIKEKFCFVSFDFDKEMAVASSSAEMDRFYEFPSGNGLNVSHECCFRSTEALFQPAMASEDGVGIHEMICDAISKCDADFRNELFRNVVLSGGNTLFAGLSARLHRELARLAQPNTDIIIAASMQQKDSTWVGGSIFASSSEFKQMCMTKEKYDEFGPSLVHRMC